MLLRFCALSLALSSFVFAMNPFDDTVFGPSPRRPINVLNDELSAFLEDLPEEDGDVSWGMDSSSLCDQSSDEEDDPNTRSSDSETSEDTFQIVDMTNSPDVETLSESQRRYFEMAKNEKLSGFQRMGAIAHMKKGHPQDYALTTLAEDKDVEMEIRKDAARILKNSQDEDTKAVGNLLWEQLKLEETEPLRKELLAKATPKGLENLTSDQEKNDVLRSCFAAFKKIPQGTKESKQAAEAIMNAAPERSPYKNMENFYTQ